MSRSSSSSSSSTDGSRSGSSGSRSKSSSSSSTSLSESDIRKKVKKELEKRFEKIRWILKPLIKLLTPVVKPVNKVLHSEPNEYKTTKMFLGFPLGCLLGYAMFRLILAPMELGEETRQLLGTMLVFGVGSGFSMAASFRCVCILMIPTFMGKAGRSYIGAFAITFLIAGPIENLVNNGQDITRSLTCAAELAANHTKAKWKLRMDPLSNVLKDMQAQGFLLNDIGHKMNKAFRPIRVEIRGEDEVVEMEKKFDEKAEKRGGPSQPKVKSPPINGDQVTGSYRKKYETRCEDIYKKAIDKCKGVFNKIKHKCYDKLPGLIDDIVCPLVNVGFLCDVIKVIGGALGAECNTDGIVQNSFGKAYKSTEDTMDTMDRGFQVDLQYKVVKSKEDLDYTSVEEMRSQTLHEFKQGRKWVNFVMVILKRLLGFTFLLVVYGAYTYYRKYQNDIKFDNNYITSYFRKIDARRKFRKKKVLLPLKKVEAESCINTASLTLMKSERQKLGKGTAILLSRMVLAGMVFFIDNIFYTVMDIIRTYSRVDYKQTGLSHINVDVAGTGIMSNIVRLFINGLSGKTVLDQTSSNLECLPRPSAVEKKYYGLVFGTYLLIWLLILCDAYALRIRRLIAGFFYRRREKMRTLYLYNTMLAKRKYFLSDMRRKVKRKAKKLKLEKRSGVLYALRRQFPGLCGCLRLFTAAKHKCLVCDDLETKAAEFRACGSVGCSYMYCKECWHDLKGTCYACMPLDEFSSTDTSQLSSDTEADL